MGQFGKASRASTNKPSNGMISLCWESSASDWTYITLTDIAMKFPVGLFSTCAVAPGAICANSVKPAGTVPSVCLPSVATLPEYYSANDFSTSWIANQIWRHKDLIGTTDQGLGASP
jgi:hypothetical protein